MILIPAKRNQKVAVYIDGNNFYNYLKDGDLVEVDANKGIIRILEKAK